jgi:hypothetical protein
MRHFGKSPIWGSALLMALPAVLIAGCAMGNIWGVQISNEVDRAFENLKVNTDYRFYYYGLENSPYAVVGIEKQYHINDPDWREVDPSSEAFKKVVGLVRYFPWYNSYTFGSYIVDAEGRRIGVWYSSLIAGFRANPETGDVIVTPNPDPLRSPL